MAGNMTIDSIETFAHSYFDELCKTLRSIPISQLEVIVQLLAKAMVERKRVFTAGNGGSAATALHMACDLSKTVLGDSYQDAQELRVVSLISNVSVISAWANDVSYDAIFAQQLSNMADPEDILIVISGSGNSRNIIAAVQMARQMGMVTIGFLGRDGGEVGKMVHHSVVIPNTKYGPIEDAHLALNHLITAYLKEVLAKKSAGEGDLPNKAAL